jgi:hypothetical protein
MTENSTRPTILFVEDEKPFSHAMTIKRSDCGGCGENQRGARALILD